MSHPVRSWSTAVLLFGVVGVFVVSFSLTISAHLMDLSNDQHDFMTVPLCYECQPSVRPWSVLHAPMHSTVLAQLTPISSNHLDWPVSISNARMVATNDGWFLQLGDDQFWTNRSHVTFNTQTYTIGACAKASHCYTFLERTACPFHVYVNATLPSYHFSWWNIQQSDASIAAQGYLELSSDVCVFPFDKTWMLGLLVFVGQVPLQ